MISWRPLRLWPWRWHLRRPRPSLWVSWRPNGIGLVKPNHYGEMLRTVWANRRNLKYGWNVLTKGACDGCALGVAGLHDWGQVAVAVLVLDHRFDFPLRFVLDTAVPGQLLRAGVLFDFFRICLGFP